MAARPGFSAIECLVSLTVLSIGLIGAGGTVSVAHRIESQARRRSAMVTDVLDEIDRFTAGDCLVRDSAWGPAPEAAWRGEWKVAVGDSVHTLLGRLEAIGSTPPGSFTITVRRACP